MRRYHHRKVDGLGHPVRPRLGRDLLSFHSRGWTPLRRCFDGFDQVAVSLRATALSILSLYATGAWKTCDLIAMLREEEIVDPYRHLLDTA